MKTSKRSFKVRFNLSAGENFMKWKVVYPDKHVEYHDPSQVLLLMTGAKLRNQKSTALKIFNGADKEVCAWIECNTLLIIDSAPMGPVMRSIQASGNTTVSYNPKKKPYWVMNETNVDNHTYDNVVTVDKQVHILPSPKFYAYERNV